MANSVTRSDEAFILAGAEDGPFHRVLDQIEALHFEVRRYSTAESFLAALEGSSPITLLAIDGSLMSETESRETFAEMKTNHPETPIIWLCASGTLAPNHLALLPEVILESEENIDTMLCKTQRLLVDHFFPRIVANAMRFSARSALKQSFHTNLLVDREYVRADHSPLSEISAVINFHGPGSRGTIIVSGTEAFFNKTCDKILPANRQKDDGEASALAGEMCNTIMGKFKAFLVQNGMKSEIGCPLTFRGETTTVEYGHGSLSLVNRLKAEKDDLFVELVLDMFDTSAIQPTVKEKILEPGGLSFF